MKTLKLETVLQSFKNSENILYERSLQQFLNGFVEQLLDLPGTEIVCPVTQDDFLGSGKHTLKNKEIQITLTEDIFLNATFDAFCEFEYNTVDETEVGLGAKGDVCGIETDWIELRKITLYTQEGSEFFLGLDEGVAEYLNNVICIE